jgi:hypothetical protein
MGFFVAVWVAVYEENLPATGIKEYTFPATVSLKRLFPR